MLSETPLKMRATRYLRILSGEYGVRDAACPVSTGCGTRRVRSVRGAGRGVSAQYGVRDAACPLCVGSSERLASCLSLAFHLCGFWVAVMKRMFPSRCCSRAARGGDRQGGGQCVPQRLRRVRLLRKEVRDVSG